MFNERKARIRKCTWSRVSGNASYLCERHVVRGNIIWSIWNKVEPGKPDYRFIQCTLLTKAPDEQWDVRSWDETAGPFYYTCPISFLNDVPEPDSIFAREWRQKVRGIADTYKCVKAGQWIMLREGCKPPFVKITSKTRGRLVCPFGRIRKKQVVRIAPEAEILEQYLDSELGRSVWRQKEPSHEEFIAMQKLAQKPFPPAHLSSPYMKIALWESLGISPVLQTLWQEQEELTSNQRQHAVSEGV